MKPALLLIDLQKDYLIAIGLQPPADALVAGAAALLNHCRSRGVPVIHAWTTIDRKDDRRLRHWKDTGRWVCVTGTPGHATPAELTPRKGERVVNKAGYNAFEDAELDATLQRAACDSVILAGLHVHACVRMAAMECMARGYRVIVAEGAVASDDPIHAAATRRWLGERGVAFRPVTEVLSLLDDGGALSGVGSPAAAEIRIATAAARRAWQPWRDRPWPQRRELLGLLADRIEADAESWARQLAIDIGKPIRDARDEVQRAAGNIRDVVRRADAPKKKGRELLFEVRRAPLGLVAVITPWNNPVAIPLGKIAPALAYGNTVVWKPAPEGTRIAQRLASLFGDIGLPGDVVRLITGDRTAAAALANDGAVDAITITGSEQAGYAVQEIAARRAVPLQAELGGNNAAVVWHDANLDHAAEQVAQGAFAFSGQRCTANRRAIVSERCYEPFLAALTAATSRLNIGDPLDETTDIGPLISAAKRDALNQCIARAKASGSAMRVIAPHVTCPPALAVAGAYLLPHIVCCDDPQHPLVQEEMMGPVLVVQRASDFDQALSLCNGVRHGLAAALFSDSAELQTRFLAEARAGILKLNAATAGVDVTLPFGGWKASGVGPPEHGEGDALFFTRIQTVYGFPDLRSNR